MYYPLVMLVWMLCWIPVDADFPTCKVYKSAEPLIECLSDEMWIRRLNFETTGCQMVSLQGE